MNTLTRFASSALLLFAAAMTGCQSPHRMRSDADGKVTVCQKCYDVAASSMTDGDAPGTEHYCSDCRTTMAVYKADGTWTIRCPKCAPEGVPCDKCLPPGAAPPESTSKSDPSWYSGT